MSLKQKKSETALGIHGEQVMADVLRGLGFTVEATSVKHPYDLLIDGCVKVDVKTANTSYVRGCPVHAYRLAKKQHTCDFYVFFENDTDAIYVVPAHVCTGQVQVEMGSGSKRYAKFKDAFYLIRECVKLFQAMDEVTNDDI